MPDYISKLNAVFQYAFTHQRPFYRDLYGGQVPDGHKIDSLKTWRELPFVTKADLQAVPLFERTFIDPRETNVIRNSSGTSGQVLVTLRTFVWKFDRYYGIYQPTGMLHFSEVSYGDENAFRLAVPDGVFVAGELGAIESGVKLAAGLSINTLSCWLYGYQKLIPLLKKYGFDLNKIEMVITFGERMTVVEYNMLKREFPNAHIGVLYGATEVQDVQLGYSIDAFDPNEGTIFRTSENLYMELIDPETGEVIEETGREGEIVVTMLWLEGNSSTLIRYRLGDGAKYLTWHEDPWQRTYTTLGRVNLEKILVPGGILQTIEFERVINLHQSEVEADFELHYTPYLENEKRQQFELWVKAKKDFDQDKFLKEVMGELRLSSIRKFEQSVAEGLIEPMTLKVVTELSREGKKRLRFIKH